MSARDDFNGFEVYAAGDGHPSIRMIDDDELHRRMWTEIDRLRAELAGLRGTA
jgi:hypothetical protein